MKRNIKILLAIVILAAIVVIPLVWIAINGADYATLDPITRAKRSTLIVYAVEKRNGNDESLVIQDVWKDKRESHSPIIGTAIEIKDVFSPSKPSRVQTPDGAVVFFEKGILDKKHLEPCYFGYVNGGKIEGMTLDEYRKASGL